MSADLRDAGEFSAMPQPDQLVIGVPGAGNNSILTSNLIFRADETFIGNLDTYLSNVYPWLSDYQEISCSLIELKVTPPQQGFPLESTQSISFNLASI